VLIVRTPDGRLTWLQAIASRRKAAVAAGIPAAFAGWLITDGYTGYQHLLSRLAGIQQCCPHVIRRCRAATRLGPGGLQSWAGDIIAILREAHQTVEEARARGGTALDPQLLAGLRERYDTRPSSARGGRSPAAAGTRHLSPARLRRSVAMITNYKCRNCLVSQTGMITAAAPAFLCIDPCRSVQAVSLHACAKQL
jgi:Transposase IS66 family